MVLVSNLQNGFGLTVFAVNTENARAKLCNLDYSYKRLISSYSCATAWET